MDDFKEVLEMDDDFPDLYEEEVENNDWYKESDTSDDIPYPNLDKLPLFQEENKLPVPLLKKYFKEGLMYARTLDDNHKVTMLVMIIEKRQNDFVYWVLQEVRKEKPTIKVLTILNVFTPKFGD